jgi:hypothetical protein
MTDTLYFAFCQRTGLIRLSSFPQAITFIYNDISTYIIVIPAIKFIAILSYLASITPL